jgi:hypothetical protein
LDAATAQLAGYETAPDMATLVKILAAAAKSALKGQSLAEALATCGSSGGGGGGKWSDWTLEVTVAGVKTMFYENAESVPQGPDIVSVVYFSTGALDVTAIKGSGFPSLNFAANVGSPASGTRPISWGSYSNGANTFTFTSGTITITKWPSTFPGRGQATFSFSADGGEAGTVSGTGKFSVWIYEPF